MGLKTTIFGCLLTVFDVNVHIGSEDSLRKISYSLTSCLRFTSLFLEICLDIYVS